MIHPESDSPLADLIRETATPWLRAGTAGIAYEESVEPGPVVLRLYPRRASGALTLLAYLEGGNTVVTAYLSDGSIEYGPLEFGLSDRDTLVDLVKAMLHGKIAGSSSTFRSRGWGRRLRWDGQDWGVMYPFYVLLLPVQHKRYGPYDAPQ